MGRQWPEVYDLCHTFLHVAQVRKHTDMRESHAFKNVLQNLIPRATAYLSDWYDEALFDFLQEQFLTLLCCDLKLPKESLASCSLIH